ncbi:MAG TPA: hypothetical protein VMD97_01935 [Candidatus Aquilonibacter sp.]|nr:hypothetical protein [Candidatus Aquilonibacter sp.]
MVTVKLTPDEFAAKSAELKAKYGVALAAPGTDGSVQGVASKDGVSIGYHYDAKLGVLTWRVVSRPRIVPLGMAESKLRGWLTT